MSKEFEQLQLLSARNPFLCFMGEDTDIFLSAIFLLKPVLQKDA
jgi:hypothetical protein